MKELYHYFTSSTGVQTDTRKLQGGELFFALSGEHFDGNQFIEKALELGANHVVASDSRWVDNKRVTVVQNVLKTLQQLATYHRQVINIPILALTGSNGKTTTKELILCVLTQKYKVKGTLGNLNNHIGVPLTLLSFDKSTEVGVVEMGANHLDEIKELSNIALPDYGLITNYGKAHLEGFGSEENIKIGKSELYDYLRVNNKKAIVASWDQEQQKRSIGIDRIYTNNDNLLLSSEPFIKFKYDNQTVDTNLVGTYNYNNILFAITVGTIFGVNPKSIIAGISNYTPTNNRSQIINKSNIKIILDAYNANPSSMNVALHNLAKQPENKKIAILGDMFELGVYTEKEHQDIADLCASLDLDQCYLIGAAFSKVQPAHNTMLFKDFDEFKPYFSRTQIDDAVLLIKGSRGMQLERVVDIIK